MTRWVLKEDSDLMKRLLQIELLYDELKVAVESYGPMIIVDRKTGQRFMVGEYRSCEAFPRSTECNFYLCKEE